MCLSSVEDITATWAVQNARRNFAFGKNEMRAGGGVRDVEGCGVKMSALRKNAARLRLGGTAEAAVSTRAYLPFALTARSHLYLSFALTLSTEPGVVIFHAQAYIPT